MFKRTIGYRNTGNNSTKHLRNNYRKYLKLIACFSPIILIALGLLVFQPVLAADATTTESKDITETIFFGNLKDDGSACGTFTVVNLIVDIFSIGVGIFAAIGITIAGINYLTAGGNEEKTRKAKHRIYQIVIGIVAYALLYVGAQWLLPGGKLNFNVTCATVSNEELAKIKAKEKAEREAERRKNEKEAEKIKPMPKQVDDASGPAAERLNNKAIELAWPVNTPKSRYVNQPTPAFVAAMRATGTNRGESGCRRSGQACGMFVGTVVRAAGIDRKFPTMAVRIYPYVRDSRLWRQVSTKNPRPGDISLSYFDSGGDAQHVSIYVRNRNGRTVTAQASLCDFYGVVEDRALYTSSNNKTFRYVGS